MSRILFENSKAALAFAGMTLVGAVAMVGTPDNGGPLGRVSTFIAEGRRTMTQDSGAQASGDGGDGVNRVVSEAPPEAPVFGDYVEPGAEFGQAASASVLPEPVDEGSAMTAPLSEEAVIIRPGDVPPAPIADPAVTQREQMFAPQ